MTQVTRFGGVIPILNSGAVGYDPGEVAGSEDTPDPVDVALGTAGTVAEVPVSVGGSTALVQSAGANENLGTTVTATFGATPTEGNLLLATTSKRSFSHYIDTLPTGWAELDRWTTGNHGDGGIGQMFYKIAGPSEPTSVAFGSTLGANDVRLCIMEYSGVGQIDISTTLDDQGPATSLAIGPVTPTGGLPAIVVAAFQGAVGDPAYPFTPPAGFTEIDDERANPAGNLGPRQEVVYKVVATTSGSYSATATIGAAVNWGAILVVLTPLDGGFIWVPADETVDGNDATYDSTAVATDSDSIWRIQLANPAKIAHVVAKIGANASGAQSTDLYGATLPDFSDEALLATRAWTATGSYTSDTIELLPAGTTAYQYYRLTGPDDVRIYTVEMFAPVTVTTADLSGYQQTSDKDQPNGYPSLDSGGLVPVAELPNIEDLNTGSTDTTKVYAPDGAGGVTLVALAGGLTPWFDLMAGYGAVNDGSTDDTTAINAWIAAFNSAGRGVLYAPAGTGYKNSGGLTTITGSGTMLGDGKASYDNAAWGSKFNCTSQTAVMFTVSTKEFRFEKVGMVNTYGGTPSAGTAVLSDSSYLEQCVNYSDCSFQGFYDNLDIKVGAQWSMRGCFNIAPVRYGVRIRNTVNGDAGDWEITGSNFSAQSYDSDAAIRIESSGGGKISNVKVNMALDGKKFNHGIDLAVAQTTVDLQVVNCSIENIRGDGFHATNTSTKTWFNITLANVQMDAMGGAPISMVATAAGDFAYVTIMGCTFRKVSGTNAIVLTNVQHVRIGGIAHNFTNTTSQTTCTDVIILDDAAAPSFATPSIALASSASAGAASTIIRSDATIAAFDATSPSTQALGDSAVVGSAAFAARRDHKHAMPALSSATPLVESGSGSVGTALPSSREDHVHPAAGGSATQHILLADGHSTPFSFTDLLQMDDGSDFMWSDP